MDMFGSDDAELTPAQQGLREESERFRWTRLQGALVGAAGGALAGWLITDDWTGAAGGAAVGGLLGYAAGYYIDTVNQSYANQQEALSTRIGAANQDIARYEQAAADARTVVASHRQKIADLNAQYARQQITADQYSDQVAVIEGDIDALQDLINESSGNVELMDKDIAQLREQGADVGGLVARAQRARRPARRAAGPARHARLRDRLDPRRGRRAGGLVRMRPMLHATVLRPLATAGLLLLAAACAPTRDPGQAGFFSGIANIVGGAYEEDTAALQAEADASEQRVAALRAENQRLTREMAELDAEERSLRERQRALNERLMEQERTLAGAARAARRRSGRARSPERAAAGARGRAAAAQRRARGGGRSGRAATARGGEPGARARARPDAAEPAGLTATAAVAQPGGSASRRGGGS